MAKYRIIGADGVEYGPVSAEQIRQWMGEGRVDTRTRLQLEGESQWKPLSEVAELTGTPTAAGPAVCPGCGEKFEEGFDSCWKCGTGKDGSPPKDFKPVEIDPRSAAQEAVEPCPKCGSANVNRGKIVPTGEGTSVLFKPDGTRFFIMSFLGGVDLCSDATLACLDCGLVWNYVLAEELKEFIAKNCRGFESQEAYALLAEGVRLETAGNISGALAKYQAVLDRFPGSPAAKGAEVSIRNATERTGLGMGLGSRSIG